MKKLLTFLFLTILPVFVLAQEKQSVVTLKNGTELKGTIKSLVPTDSLTIVISGIETSIKMSDVAKIEEAKETISVPQQTISERIPPKDRKKDVESFTAITNEGRFCFNVLSEAEKTVEITHNKNVAFTEENLIIPPTVEYKGNLYTVIAIGEEAFAKNKKIKTIDIPNTIISIGEEAFKSCTKLTRLTFSTGLKEIGEEAFEGCIKLIEVSFSPGIEKIGEKAFALCIKLSEVDLPEGLLRIEEQAFQACPLEKIDIPNTVTFIGRRAFFSANGFIGMQSKIKWLSIPESVVEIDKQAFCKFINLYGTALSSKCHIELLPSWLSEDDAKRIGISEDSYRDYKNKSN